LIEAAESARQKLDAVMMLRGCDLAQAICRNTRHLSPVAVAFQPSVKFFRYLFGIALILPSPRRISCSHRYPRWRCSAHCERNSMLCRKLHEPHRVAPLRWLR
jgi:hypothetical protein